MADISEISGRGLEHSIPHIPLTPADILTGGFLRKIKKKVSPILKKMQENIRKRTIEEFLTKEEFLKHIDIVADIFLNSSKGIQKNLLSEVLKKDTRKAHEQIQVAGKNAKKLQKLSKLPKQDLLKWIENVLL